MYLQYSTYVIVVHKVLRLKLWTLRLCCLDIFSERNSNTGLIKMQNEDTVLNGA